MKKAKASASTQLTIGVSGDRRVAENIILEARAAAERLGLTIEDIQVVSSPAANGKKQKTPSRQRRRS